MSRLFTVEVVDVKGEPLPGATIACYTPLCCEVAYTDTVHVPDTLDPFDSSTNMILRVRKYGYLPKEIVVSHSEHMPTIRVTLVEDRVYTSEEVWAEKIEKIKTKVQDTFVGLKDLLI